MSDHLKNLIEDKDNNIYLSFVSLWEMSIKYNLGKLKLATSYEEFVEVEIIQSCFNLLNIEIKHFNINATLPFHHRDPFDRLIIIPFTINSGFVQGINTLDFVVQDVGSISGFRVGEISGTAQPKGTNPPSVPEPASALGILAVGFLGASSRCQRQFQKKD